MATDIVIYHNPACGTSRNVLGLIRNAGIEPHVVEYLKTPPSRALLVELIDRAGITPRDLLREKGTPYAELGLGDTSLSDDALIDAMMGSGHRTGTDIRSHDCHPRRWPSLLLRWPGSQRRIDLGGCAAGA